jgi:hypothetical protein
VNEGRVRGDKATHELRERLAKENSVVIALFETHGVLAKDVKGRNDLHSSELAY